MLFGSQDPTRYQPILSTRRMSSAQRAIRLCSNGSIVASVLPLSILSMFSITLFTNPTMFAPRSKSDQKSTPNKCKRVPTNIHFQRSNHTNIRPIINHHLPLHQLAIIPLLLPSWNRRNRPSRLEDTQIHQPSRSVELRMQRVNAVIIRIPFLGRLSLQNRNTKDRNSSRFGRLAHGRAHSLPAHRYGAVTVVPDLDGLERDGFLFAVAFHELGAGGEDGLGHILS
jgi:hypothetical protein